MQTIEINTAQNVRIGYELAGVGQRIFAYLIDFCVMALVMLVFVSLAPDAESDLFINIFAFFWLGFYTLLGELLGRSAEDRLPGSLALAVAARQRGARIVRVHDVAATLDVFRTLDAVGGSRPSV